MFGVGMRQILLEASCPGDDLAVDEVVDCGFPQRQVVQEVTMLWVRLLVSIDQKVEQAVVGAV